MRSKRVVITVSFVLAAASVRAERFEIDPADKANLVRFESKAPMESFDGRTHRVSGYINLDPAAIGDSVDAFVQVEMASLDTGISLRNKHMRENHLDTDSYPYATFRGVRIVEGAAGALAPGVEVPLIVEGTMNLHGVERRIRVPATVALPTEGEPRLRITSEFEIYLADYEISRPKFLFLKLDEKQRIQLELYATAPGAATR